MDKSKKFAGGILLFCVLLFNNAYFFPAIEYDNARSRFYLLSAIVDFKQFNIDFYAKYTIDKSLYRGTYYSNKAIGSPFMAVPVYGIARQVLPKKYDYPLSWPSRYIVTLLTTSLFSAVCGVLLWLLAMAWGRAPFTSLLMVLAFSFGTIIWVNSSMFSGHVMAAALLFSGFYVLWHCKKRIAESRPDRNIKVPSAGLSLFAGILVGFAGLCDYTAIFMCPIIAIYVFIINIRNSNRAFFFLGAGLCASLLLYYNWICFASPFSTSYHHNALEAFSQGSKHGFIGIGLPAPYVVFKLLFSPSRGLFFIMPVLVFSVFGFREFYKETALRVEFWIFLSLIFCNLFVNAGFYGWHGGWTLGPRYLVVMLPFIALPLAFAPLRNKYFYMLLGLSIFQIFPGVAFFPYAPSEINNPQFELVLPLIKSGYYAFNLGLLLGLNKVTSISVWFAFNLIALLWLIRFVTRNTPYRLPHSAEPQGREISKKEKIFCVITAFVIAVSFFTVSTDKDLVTQYQNLLLDHYHNSPWRNSVLFEIQHVE
jgi:hypothetical protein